jgi:hypothetical protein
MTLAVVSRRLGWWFAIETDRSVWPLAAYILTAGVVGILWDLVLFWIPYTSRPFSEAIGSPGPLEHILSGSALVATSCVVSTAFRRPIIRAKPILIPGLATGMVLLAAGLFMWMRIALGAVAGESGWDWDEATLAGFIVSPLFGVWAALHEGLVTIPVAILSVLLLRIVSRAR